MSGTLFLVSTPIGNLDDITLRAVKILREADAILAEDTRVSRRLLDHLDIQSSVIPYHDFNKEKVSGRLVERMMSGESLALITDAGTPGVADPAFYLVREAITAGITISPIPGPSAVLSALVCSGLPCDRFTFENFMPVKSGKRRRVLQQYTDDPRTVIFYESPHRITKVLRDMTEVLGPIPVVIARELTKIHEEFLRGTPDELSTHYENRKPRGEMVVLFNSQYKGNRTAPQEPETPENYPAIR